MGFMTNSSSDDYHSVWPFSAIKILIRNLRNLRNAAILKGNQPSQSRAAEDIVIVSPDAFQKDRLVQPFHRM